MAQGATAAVSSAGLLVQFEPTYGSATFVDVLEVLNVDGPDGQTELIEVTSLGSPGARREYILGYIDEGMFTFSVNYLPSDADQLSLETARTARTKRKFKVTIAGGGTNDLIAFEGLVMSGRFSMQPGQQVKRDWSVKITSSVTIT